MLKKRAETLPGRKFLALVTPRRPSHVGISSHLNATSRWYSVNRWRVCCGIILSTPFPVVDVDLKAAASLGDILAKWRLQRRMEKTFLSSGPTETSPTCRSQIPSPQNLSAETRPQPRQRTNIASTPLAEPCGRCFCQAKVERVPFPTSNHVMCRNSCSTIVGSGSAANQSASAEQGLNLSGCQVIGNLVST